MKFLHCSSCVKWIHAFQYCLISYFRCILYCFLQAFSGKVSTRVFQHILCIRTHICTETRMGNPSMSLIRFVQGWKLSLCTMPWCCEANKKKKSSIFFLGAIWTWLGHTPAVLFRRKINFIEPKRTQALDVQSVAIHSYDLLVAAVTAKWKHYLSYTEWCGRLCGLVVRVLGYRSGGPGSIPGTTRKKR
jgi:hypothetical protein